MSVVPLSGMRTRQQLVKCYNDTYRSRILASLKIDRFFGVIMTEQRMERILVALTEWGYLRASRVDGALYYRLTASGAQAKLNNKR